MNPTPIQTVNLRVNSPGSGAGRINLRVNSPGSEAGRIKLRVNSPGSEAGRINSGGKSLEESNGLPQSKQKD
jgi:hypothetical protein